MLIAWGDNPGSPMTSGCFEFREDPKHLRHGNGADPPRRREVILLRAANGTGRLGATLPPQGDAGLGCNTGPERAPLAVSPRQAALLLASGVEFDLGAEGAA